MTANRIIAAAATGGVAGILLIDGIVATHQREASVHGLIQFLIFFELNGFTSTFRGKLFKKAIMPFTGKDATEEFDVLHDRTVTKRSGVGQDTVVIRDKRAIQTPHDPGQQEAIAQAIKNAAMSPMEVEMVEGHFNGKFPDDAIEVNTMWRATRSDVNKEPVCFCVVKSSMMNQV